MTKKQKQIVEQVIQSIQNQIPRRELPAVASRFAHDLRSPLASVITALRALQSHGHMFDPQQQQDIIAQSLEQAERLDTNIMTMINQVVQHRAVALN